MEILFNDFKKQYTSIKTEIDSAVHEVLNSWWFILWKQVESFEWHQQISLLPKYTYKSFFLCFPKQLPPSLVFQLRIKGITQAISEKVEDKDCQADDNGRKEK